MLFTAFFAAFAGLELVIASPVPTGLAENAGFGAVPTVFAKHAGHGPAPAGPATIPRGTLLFWDPPNAYRTQPKRKSHWEDKCYEALDQERCAVGRIHQGETHVLQADGASKMSYLNIEGAPSTAQLGKSSKRMRVFHDGHIEHGWSKKDWRSLRKAKHARKEKKRPDNLQKHQHHEGSTALLFWDPADAYRGLHKKRKFWEERCDVALTREGCRVGIIHQGVTRFRSLLGVKSSYVGVEGWPSAEQSMGNPIKMRVFQDASSTLGWSAEDRKFTMTAKTLSRKKSKAKKPLEGVEPWNPKTLLSWDPAQGYINQSARKLLWEQKCDAALTREGCRVGVIHKGETKASKDGNNIFYVRVEGAPDVGMKFGKKMRVFQDGSYQPVDGWTDRDLKLMAESKRLRGPDREKGQKHMGPKGMNATAQAPTTQEKTQEKYDHGISWDPPNAYAEHYPHLRQSYEEACHQALTREGCDFGKIRQGQHRLDNPDGTVSFWMDVSAGRNDDPEKTRYMRVFEDGSSQWYPPGKLPNGRKNPVRGGRRGSARPPKKKARTSPAEPYRASPEPPHQASHRGGDHQAPPQAPYEAPHEEARLQVPHDATYHQPSPQSPYEGFYEALFQVPYPEPYHE